MKRPKTIATGAIALMIGVSYLTLPNKNRKEVSHNPSADVANLQKFKKKKFSIKKQKESFNE